MLYFHSLSVAGNFGVGALLAWWTFTFNKTVLPPILVKLTYLALFVSLVAFSLLFSNPVAIVLERLWFSILFAVIIFDWAFSKKPLTNPGKYPVLNFLGQISLGLYVFHALVISVFSYFNYRFDWSDSAWQVTLINPLLIFIVTLILAMLSYKYFEKPFLKFRTWGQELSKQ
jgi:peptidoglycan/LPS O-acetylase OafA/YrhL